MKVFVAVALLFACQAAAASIDEIRQLLARLHPKTDVKPLHRNEERGLPSPVYWTDGTGREFPEKPEPYYHMNGFRRCNYVSDFRDLWTIPMSMEMTDVFEYRPEYVDTIMTVLDTFRDVDDYEALTILTLRNLTRRFMMDRARCPASMFEIFVIEYMRREYYRESDFPMMNELLSVLERIPITTPTMYTPEQVATMSAKEIYGHIFNDTMYWVLYKSMDDVFKFARSFEPIIKSTIPLMRTMEPTAMRDHLKTLVQDNLGWVHCPSEEQVLMKMKESLYGLSNGLEDIEIHELCEGVRTFLSTFYPEITMNADDPKYGEILEDACNIVRKYMDKVVVRLPDYIKMIEMRDPAILFQKMGDYFEDYEMAILTKVVEKLGWPYVSPVPSDPPVLTVGDIIATEETDLDIWQSLLDHLTPEYFATMDTDEFRTFIENWLEEKRRRIEAYYSRIV